MLPIAAFAAALASTATPLAAQSSASRIARVVALPAALPVTKPRITGATPEQRALLVDILSRLGRPSIESIRLERRDLRDWDGELRSLGIEKPRDYVPPDDVELAVTWRPSEDPALARWQGRLLADAFRVLSAREGLPPVVSFAYPDGAEAIGPGSFEDVDWVAAREREPRPLAPAEGDALLERAREAARASGAAVERIELLRPYAHAILVVVRTDDAREFLSTRVEALVEALEPWVEKTAGDFVEVRDARGSAWSSGSYSSAFHGGGAGGARADLECVDPYWRGTSSVTEPPPCD